MSTPERDPSTYEDLMIEAVRIAAVGRDVVVAFQLWDMDDFDVESTLLFRTQDFREAERIGTADGLWVDTRGFGDQLYALQRKTMHVYAAGKYDAPRTSHQVPIVGVKAFTGTPDALWAVGKGAARWDGTSWTPHPLGGKHEGKKLTAVHAAGERAYAVGEHGLVCELGAKGPRVLSSPTERELLGVHVQPDGTLSLAGDHAWQGPPKAPIALTVRDGVEDFVDVTEFRGQLYWSAGGQHGGLFVQEGDRLVQVLGWRCWHLTATDEFLYVAGEREVFRFDGTSWLQMNLAYDVPTQRWALTAYDEAAIRDDSFDEIVVAGSYAVKKPGALERALGKFFDQRNDSAHVKSWKAPKGFTAALVGHERDASLVVDDGRCSFTLPLLVKDIDALRSFLEAGKATEIELRRASAEDVATIKEREAAAAAKPTKKAKGKGPKLVREQEGAKITRASQTVSMIFEYAKDTEPSYDLTRIGDEVIGFGSHRKSKRGVAAGPQLHVIRGLTQRTVFNLVLPTARPQGISVGADGTLWAGSDEGTLYVSEDQGRSWAEEPAPGLQELVQGTFVSSTAWFEGELWIASKLGVARRIGDTWSPVPLPASVDLPGMYEALKLVVSAGVLYVLGVGVARWNGSELVTELGKELLPERRFLSPSAVISLTTTGEGTLLVSGARIFRKAAGQTWQSLEPSALGIDPERPAAEAGYENLIALGNTVVVTSNSESPHEQVHAVRVSTDDGVSFRPLPIDNDDKVIPSSAVADPEGGVLIAGFGGALLRVTP